MRRWVRSLLVLGLVFLLGTPALAASLGSISPVITPEKAIAVKPPIPIAFSAIPNRYTDVDPATTFDLNGDLVGDITVSATTITGKNGAKVQLLDPAVLNLDQVQKVPQSGYAATAATQLSRAFVAQLSDGWYAKFMILQASPKVTIWFHAGKQTPSVLDADGTGSHAVLTWGALPDAQLGYNVYRYEFLDNSSYTVTLLNDFTVQETTFTDNTAQNHYYLYVVIAMKSDGSFGSSTTVAPVQVQSAQHTLVVSLTAGTAKLDGAPTPLDAAPVIKNGRLMVPASLLDAAGVKTTVEAGQITMARRLDNVTYTVVMTLDSPDYTWNGSAYKADVPPYMSGSAVMIPLRVVAPALAFGLSFSSTDRTATIQWFE